MPRLQTVLQRTIALSTTSACSSPRTSPASRPHCAGPTSALTLIKRRSKSCHRRTASTRIDDTTPYVLMDTTTTPTSPSTASPISAPMPRANCWPASAWATPARPPCRPGSPIHRPPARSRAGTRPLNPPPALPTRVLRSRHPERHGRSHRRLERRRLPGPGIHRLTFA